MSNKTKLMKIKVMEKVMMRKITMTMTKKTPTMSLILRQLMRKVSLEMS